MSHPDLLIAMSRSEERRLRTQAPERPVVSLIDLHNIIDEMRDDAKSKLTMPIQNLRYWAARIEKAIGGV